MANSARACMWQMALTGGRWHEHAHTHTVGTLTLKYSSQHEGGAFQPRPAQPTSALKWLVPCNHVFGGISVSQGLDLLELQEQANRSMQQQDLRPAGRSCAEYGGRHAGVHILLDTLLQSPQA